MGPQFPGADKGRMLVGKIPEFQKSMRSHEKVSHLFTAESAYVAKRVKLGTEAAVKVVWR